MKRLDLITSISGTQLATCPWDIFRIKCEEAMLPVFETKRVTETP